MGKIQIKPYYLKELAALYEVSCYTMRKYISKIPNLGEKVGHKWNNNQVNKIFEHLGEPQKD